MKWHVQGQSTFKVPMFEISSLLIKIQFVRIQDVSPPVSGCRVTGEEEAAPARENETCVRGSIPIEQPRALPLRIFMSREKESGMSRVCPDHPLAPSVALL
jgi:hypothetical protein